MNTEFFSLGFSRAELRELHEALVLKSMLEDDLRREKGLEPPVHPLLGRVEELLKMSDRQIETVSDLADTSLWEYAWYTYTDEWAWYRAQQDVEKEVDGFRSLGAEEARALVERKYEAEFERYVKEVDMKDAPPSAKGETRRKAA